MSETVHSTIIATVYFLWTDLAPSAEQAATLDPNSTLDK